MTAFADLVTRIGVGGCAVLGVAFLAIAIRCAMIGRNTPERQRELERIDRWLQRWTGLQ